MKLSRKKITNLAILTSFTSSISYASDFSLTKAIRNINEATYLESFLSTKNNIKQPYHFSYHLFRLKSLANNKAEFSSSIRSLFGYEISQSAVEELRLFLLNAQLNDLPAIVLSRNLPEHAAAAYIHDTRQIMIAPDVPLASAYAEELGHWIDAQLRSNHAVRSHDAIGDEGALFRLWLESDLPLSFASLNNIKQVHSDVLIEDDTYVDHELGVMELMKRKSRSCDKPVGFYACHDHNADNEEDDYAPTTKKKARIATADLTKLKADIADNIETYDISGTNVLTGNNALNALADPIKTGSSPSLTLRFPDNESGNPRAIRFKFKHNGKGSLLSHLTKLNNQWNSEKNINQMQEVMGEIATTQYVLDKYSNAELIFGADKTQSSGIDQLWKTGSRDYLFAEAKGAGSTLRDVPNDLTQMSEEWIIDRLVRLARSRNSDDASAIAAKNALEEFGFKYQGYGYYQKIKGRWTTLGSRSDIHYRLSGNPNPNNIRFKAAVVTDTFSKKSNSPKSYELFDPYHNGDSSPKSLSFDPDTQFGENVHIPDPQMGSLHELMWEESSTYRSRVNTALNAQDGDGLTMLLELGDNRHGRPASYRLDSATISIHKKALVNSNSKNPDIDAAKRSEVATKLAGEIAMEVSNASYHNDYKDIYDNISSYSNTEYADQILNQEWQAVSKAKSIKSQLSSSGVLSSNSVLSRPTDFLQMTTNNQSAWIAEQKQTRPSGKDSIFDLYKNQYSEVLSGNLSKHIIRKPATNKTKLKNEIKHELEKYESNAEQYYNNFDSKLNNGQYDEADLARRQADYLTGMYKYRLGELDDDGLFSASEIASFSSDFSALKNKSTEIYTNHLIPMAEDHINKAEIAQQRISELVKKHEYREAIDVQTQSEYLLHIADNLAAEIRSAVSNGVIQESDLSASSSLDWRAYSTGADHDKTFGNRPKFIADSIEEHITVRETLARNMLEHFESQLIQLTKKVNGINNVTDEDAVADLTDVINASNDAQLLTDSLDGLPDGVMKSAVNGIKNEFISLKSALNTKGIKVAWSENMGAINRARSVSYEVLRRGGTLHGLVEKGGKYLLFLSVLDESGKLIYRVLQANSMDQVFEALGSTEDFVWNNFVGILADRSAIALRNWAVSGVVRGAERYGVTTAVAAVSERVAGTVAVEWVGAAVANATPIGWVVDVGLGIWAFSEGVKWFGSHHTAYSKDHKNHEHHMAGSQQYNMDDILDVEPQVIGLFDESMFDATPSESGIVSLTHPDTQLTLLPPNKPYPFLKHSLGWAHDEGLTEWAIVKARLVDSEGYPVTNTNVYVADFLSDSCPVTFPVVKENIRENILDIRDILELGAKLGHHVVAPFEFHEDDSEGFNEYFRTDEDGIVNFIAIAANEELVSGLGPQALTTNPNSDSTLKLHLKIDTNSNNEVDTLLPGEPLKISYDPNWLNKISSEHSTFNKKENSHKIVEIQLKNEYGVNITEPTKVSFHIIGDDVEFINQESDYVATASNGYKSARLYKSCLKKITVSVKAKYDSNGDGNTDTYLNNGQATQINMPITCGG